MVLGPCPSCGGSGQRQEYRAKQNPDGTMGSELVSVPCSGCGGTGTRDNPA